MTDVHGSAVARLVLGILGEEAGVRALAALELDGALLIAVQRMLAPITIGRVDFDGAAARKD